MIAKLAAYIRQVSGSGRPVHRHRPLTEVGFVVLDIETTGLRGDADEILEVGAVKMVGSRILVGRTFHRLVCPRQNSWGRTVPIHRIRPADVATAPPVEAVIPELVDFCRDHIIVGHKVGFDRAFLRRAGFPVDEFSWVDTGRVERWLAAQAARQPEAAGLPEAEDLETLARRYRVDLLRPHNALADALATAQVWQRQLARLEEFGVRTVADLALVNRQA